MRRTTAHYGHGGWAMPVTYTKPTTLDYIKTGLLAATAPAILTLVAILGGATIAYAWEVISTWTS